MNPTGTKTTTINAASRSAPKPYTTCAKPDGQTLTTNFFLAFGASINGQVFGNSSPMTNAVVALTDGNGYSTGGVADINGKFAVTSLSPGAYTVVAKAPGFAPFLTVTSLVAGATVDMGAVALTPGATISAALADSSSRPITNGILTLLQNANPVAQQVTDANGKAAFTGLAAGTYLLTVSAYGFQNTSNIVTVAAGTSVTNAVALAKLGSILGQVTDRTGAPISGIDVNVVGVAASTEVISFFVQTDTQEAHPDSPFSQFMLKQRGPRTDVARMTRLQRLTSAVTFLLWGCLFLGLWLLTGYLTFELRIELPGHQLFGDHQRLRGKQNHSAVTFANRHGFLAEAASDGRITFEHPFKADQLRRGRQKSSRPFWIVSPPDLV